MTDYQNNEKILQKLTIHHENEQFIETIVRNIRIILKNQSMTISQLAEKADISNSTLNSIMQCKSNTITFDNLYYISKALNVGMHELSGCDTVTPEEREIATKYRTLDDRSKYIVDWFINRQYMFYVKEEKKKNKYIEVFTPRADEKGNLYPSNDMFQMDISECSPELQAKVFVGVIIKSDGYMPRYSPYDVLLIANDRPQLPSEESIIIYQKQVFIAKAKTEFDGNIQTINFYSIRDGKYRCNIGDVDNVLGYIAGTMIRK